MVRVGEEVAFADCNAHEKHMRIPASNKLFIGVICNHFGPEVVIG
jgi:hypothetical protein